MELHLNKQPSAIVGILLFSIGIMLSCNAFAGKPIDARYATQEALDTEIRDRLAADAALQSQINNTVLPALPTAPPDGGFVLTYCVDTDSLEWTTGSLYGIGDTGPAGGIIFHVSDCGMHGMEVAPEDLGYAEWGCTDIDVPGADGVAVGTGAQNTAEIIQEGCIPFNPSYVVAAELADEYEFNGYTDWFLPSNDELVLVNSNVHQEGLGVFFDQAGYWSSSEYDLSPDDAACFVVLSPGNEGCRSGAFTSKNLRQKVLVVRAF